MSSLDFTNFDFSPEEIRDIRDLVWDGIVKAPEFSQLMTIYPNIVSGKQMGYIGDVGLIITADSGCGSSPSDYSIPTRMVQWNPVAWEALIEECYSDLENTSAVYAMNKGVAMADLTNTDYIAIVVNALTESIKQSILALALYGDTTSNDANLNLIDGLFKQALTQITANSEQGTTVALNSITSSTLMDLITSANPILRGDSTAKIYMSLSMYDAYIKSMVASGYSDTAFKMYLDGYKPTVLGVEIMPMPILDTLATKASGNPFMIYTAPKYLGLGVDTNAFGDVDVYYDRATKKTLIRAMGKLDFKLLNPEMFTMRYVSGS